MSDITGASSPEDATAYACPECGYLILGSVYWRFKANIDCPRCGRFEIAVFTKRPFPLPQEGDVQ